MDLVLTPRTRSTYPMDRLEVLLAAFLNCYFQEPLVLHSQEYHTRPPECYEYAVMYRAKRQIGKLAAGTRRFGSWMQEAGCSSDVDAPEAPSSIVRFAPARTRTFEVASSLRRHNPDTIIISHMQPPLQPSVRPY